MAAAGSPAFTAAHGVIDRVHGNAANVRPASLPARSAGLAQPDIHVVGVADHPHRGPALSRDSPNLARRQRDLRPVSIAGRQDRADTRRAAELAAAARLHLDVVDGQAGRDLGQRNAVAHLGLGIGAARDAHAGGQAIGRQDVPLFPIFVLDERDPGRAIRVVLDVSHGGRLAVAITAHPIDDSVFALVAATAMSRRDEALVVPAPGLLQRLGQALLGLLVLVRQLGEVADRGIPPARAGRFVVRIPIEPFPHPRWANVQGLPASVSLSIKVDPVFFK